MAPLDNTYDLSIVPQIITSIPPAGSPPPAVAPAANAPSSADWAAYERNSRAMTEAGYPTETPSSDPATRERETILDGALRDASSLGGRRDAQLTDEEAFRLNDDLRDVIRQGLRGDDRSVATYNALRGALGSRDVASRPPSPAPPVDPAGSDRALLYAKTQSDLDALGGRGGPLLRDKEAWQLNVDLQQLKRSGAGVPADGRDELMQKLYATLGGRLDEDVLKKPAPAS